MHQRYRCGRFLPSNIFVCIEKETSMMTVVSQTSNDLALTVQWNLVNRAGFCSKWDVSCCVDPPLPK